ncbi:DUF4136 domain-containing protein [Roseivirga pacifica]
MKKTAKRLGLAMLMLMIGLTGFAQVKSDYSKEADFSKIKTYSFAGWQKESGDVINEIDQKRIQNAIAAELEKRGLEYKEDNADAVVTLFAVVDTKTSRSSYTNFNGGYGYRGRWGWGAMPLTATTQYTEYDYRVGTLVIDMYDNDEKELIWQGVISSTVKENPKNREKRIQRRVAKLFKQIPIEVVK